MRGRGAPHVYVAVVGIFDSLEGAEKARSALLAAGVLGRRISVKQDENGYAVRVQAESSLERERIRDVLVRSQARRSFITSR